MSKRETVGVDEHTVQDRRLEVFDVEGRIDEAFEAASEATHT
jgi:hypothetical protein